MIKIAALPLLSAILLWPISVHAAQVEHHEQHDEIASLMQGYADYRAFSGAVAVAVDGETIFTESYGYANREWSIANTAETRFSIASVSKPFTAALTLRLIQAGKLTLDDHVADYLPTYRADTGSKISIHHLLTHSSGLPNLLGTKEFWTGNACRLDYDRQEFVQKYDSGDLLFTPGSRTFYSDANYTLLALIAESVTGLSHAEAMRHYVLDPVGALDTGFVDMRTILESSAFGYIREGRKYSIAPQINYSHVQLGAGDMYSTVGDLLRFEWATTSPDFLDERFQSYMFTQQVAGVSDNWHYGCGWAVGTYQLRGAGGTIPIAHAPGNNAGFSAIIYRVLDRDITISLVQNAGPGFLDMQIYEICQEIVHLLYGLSPNVPPIDIADLLETVVRRDGVESAISAYDEYFATRVDEDRSVQRMNRLGYRLLKEGSVEEAITIFELNVRSAPGSFNTYDSLGEAYFVSGDLANARRNYQRALELDPENQTAALMLNRIQAQSSNDEAK